MAGKGDFREWAEAEDNEFYSLDAFLNKTGAWAEFGSDDDK